MTFVIERWKLDGRFTYVFDRKTRRDKDCPYLAVVDDFGNLIEVDPNFDVLD
jgi:hypothetical protein